MSGYVNNHTSFLESKAFCSLTGRAPAPTVTTSSITLPKGPWWLVCRSNTFTRWIPVLNTIITYWRIQILFLIFEGPQELISQFLSPTLLILWGWLSCSHLVAGLAHFHCKASWAVHTSVVVPTGVPIFCGFAHIIVMLTVEMFHTLVLVLHILGLWYIEDCSTVVVPAITNKRAACQRFWPPFLNRQVYLCL